MTPFSAGLTLRCAHGALLNSPICSRTCRRRPQRSGWLAGPVRWWSGLSARVELAWRAPRWPSLVLPRGDRVFSIGRSPQSDLAIGDITVSWRHAEFRRTAGEWVLVDLGSTNGTRVNGWQAGAGFPVRPGDLVRFGGAVFRVAG